VPLGVEAVRSIGVYLREVRDVVAREYSGDALWLGIDGRALGCTGLGSMVKRYATMPGITTIIGLHSIRRACATHMLRHGAPAAAIQLLLGHADMSHLSQYLKVTINDLRNAHEHSRLGA
jgi:integrase/recombinase XerC